MAEFTLRREVLYNKNRPLESIFQNTAARILDFLIVNQKFDYSAPEMSRIIRVPLRTIQRVLPHLVEKKLIKETGRIGNTRMYMLNTESKLSELLTQFVLTTININIDSARKKQKQQQHHEVRQITGS
jgi:hypothetical protein